MNEEEALEPTTEDVKKEDTKVKKNLQKEKSMSLTKKEEIIFKKIKVASENNPENLSFHLMTLNFLQPLLIK